MFSGPMLLSIVVFFVISLGLSFFVDLFLRWDGDLLEQISMRIGIGIALATIFGVIFNLLHIPLDWKVFTAVALLLPALAIYLKRSSFPAAVRGLGSVSFTRVTKKQIYSVLLLVMFFITAYMYIQGSFNYPWFEDGDPYAYALASKYIALEKTYSAPFHFEKIGEPYSQGYQIFMGIMHQTNDSLYWSMKFFNALIVSFSILFFFYFARRFTKSSDTAIISTFALFAVPSWVSHFVFSLNFNMALFPVFLYVLLKINDNKQWKYPAMFVYASILVNHANTALTISMFLVLYYLNKVFVEEEINTDLIHVIFFGFLLSLLFWLFSLLKFKDLFFISRPIETGGVERFFPFLYNIFSSYLTTFIVLAVILAIYFTRNRWFVVVKKLISGEKAKHRIFFGALALVFLVLMLPSEKFLAIAGTGTRDYTLRDFFFAQKGNLINNPIGVGLVLMILFSIGLLLILVNYRRLFKKENFWVSMTLVWTIVSLLIIFGTYFSLMYMPFRMWTFFGLFSSLVVGFAVTTLLKGVKQKHMKILVLVILVILVIPTSFSQKYWNNTSVWPEHFIMVPQSQQLYIWMREGGLPKDSRVVNICHAPALMFGYDMIAPAWESEQMASRREFVPSKTGAYYRNAVNSSLESNYNFLKENKIDYVVIGASCIAKFQKKIDAGLVNARLQEMINSTQFLLVRNAETEFLFRVI